MNLLDNVPFAKLLGIEIESIEPGHSVLTMKIRADLKQNHGVAHGGSIAAVIDSAMALAIMPMLGASRARRQTRDHRLRRIVRPQGKTRRNSHQYLSAPSCVNPCLKPRLLS